MTNNLLNNGDDDLIDQILISSSLVRTWSGYIAFISFERISGML